MKHANIIKFMSAKQRECLLSELDARRRFWYDTYEDLQADSEATEDDRNWAWDQYTDIGEEIDDYKRIIENS